MVLDQILYILIKTINYVLMLAAMTFNVYVFGAIIGGTALSNFAVSVFQDF